MAEATPIEESIVIDSAPTTEPTAESSEAPKMDDGKLMEQMTKAAKQIEFYFADSNLPYDKFMWTLYTKDPDHWVPVHTVASFKRMREFSANGEEWIANALRLSDFLEVDETGTKVRRRTEVQEPKDSFERSVYAKGFPDEDNTLQKRIEEFFNQYGTTTAVRMRRGDDKSFKNSVFAEFVDYASVDAFLKADPKPTFEGKELLIMTKDAYCEMKIKEKGLTGKSANNRRNLIANNTRGFNAFREMAKGKQDKKPKADSEAPKEVFLEFMGTKLLITKDKEGNGTVDEKEIPFVKGATLKFDGCGGDVKWQEIKDPVKERFDGRAPFIKYSRGDNHGLVGFHKALSEEDITYIKETIKTINENEVTWTLPSEEDEKQFQIERAQSGAKLALQGGFSRDRDSGGRGRGRGRGGGGRGGGRGGRGRGGHGDRQRRGGDRNAEREKEKGQQKGEEVGEKRKRAVEPDGGPLVGQRGTAAPPMLAPSTSKRSKTDGEES